MAGLWHTRFAGLMDVGHTGMFLVPMTLMQDTTGVGGPASVITIIDSSFVRTEDINFFDTMNLT